MEWTREGLVAAGFEGFVSFAALPTSQVPAGPGVYVVLRPDAAPPVFLPENIGREIKGKRHTESVTTLEQAWLPDAEVVYIGKADLGKARSDGAPGPRGIAQRLKEYRLHGANLGGSHRGGRYLWQLRYSNALLVAWREDTAAAAHATETEMLDDFIDQYGKLPFANLQNGRGSRHRKARATPRMRQA